MMMMRGAVCWVGFDKFDGWIDIIERKGRDR